MAAGTRKETIMTQQEQAVHFAGLHSKGNPLLLLNVWDAGSARVVQESGARAIATGSWSVATAHGFKDEEHLPLDLVLANLERIVASVKLPVSLDIESGYGKTPDEVAETIALVVETGVVGINLEDQIVGGEGRYSLKQQCQRIRAARRAAHTAGIPLFINARTDIYLQTSPEEHGKNQLEEAVARSTAYADVGANGFFAPGLRDSHAIQTLCERSPLPVNVMVMDDTPPIRQLTDLGVARVSFGPGPYIQAMNAIRHMASALA